VIKIKIIFRTKEVIFKICILSLKPFFYYLTKYNWTNLFSRLFVRLKLIFFTLRWQTLVKQFLKICSLNVAKWVQSQWVKEQDKLANQRSLHLLPKGSKCFKQPSEASKGRKYYSMMTREYLLMMEETYAIVFLKAVRVASLRVLNVKVKSVVSPVG